MHFAEYDSPVGKLILCSDGKALKGLGFGAAVPEVTEEDAVLALARQWLEAYFRGEQPAAPVPLDPEGTAFQKQVWQMLSEIPYGQVTTYGQLARRFPGKLSAQAIGRAVGKNPIALLIPCHRCIGAKGRLTGYAWGLEKKQWLLELEQKGRTSQWVL